MEHYTNYRQDGLIFISECKCGWSEQSSTRGDAVGKNKAHIRESQQWPDEDTPARTLHSAAAGNPWDCQQCRIALTGGAEFYDTFNEHCTETNTVCTLDGCLGTMLILPETTEFDESDIPVWDSDEVYHECQGELNEYGSLVCKVCKMGIPSGKDPWGDAA